MSYSVDTRAIDFFEEKAQEVLGPESDFVLADIFEGLRRVFLDGEPIADVLEELRQDDYEKDFDFLSALQQYDDIIREGASYPSWDEEESAVVVSIDNLNEIAADAFLQLVRSDSFMESLFLTQYLACCFLGGLWELNFMDYDVSPIMSAYEAMKPKYIAYMLGKGYTGTRKSIPEALDLTDIPEYLIDGNPNIVRYEGQYYFVHDVAKMITASGGAAQTLETQDLETKRAKLNRLTKDVGKDDDEDVGEEEGGGNPSKKRKDNA